MPKEIGSLILRRSIGALRARPDCGCSRCRRVPVPGELVYASESSSRLCSLCASKLSEGERASLTGERVHSYERHVFAVPRAA